jgi:hypothetical protein
MSDLGLVFKVLCDFLLFVFKVDGPPTSKTFFKPGGSNLKILRFTIPKAMATHQSRAYQETDNINISEWVGETMDMSQG